MTREQARPKARKGQAVAKSTEKRVTEPTAEGGSKGHSDGTTTDLATYSTRFQGSKKRVIGWLTGELDRSLPRNATVLDAFTGTGTVAYALATRGHTIKACDQLLSSTVCVQAFIGNQSALPMADILHEIGALSSTPTDGFLAGAFQGVFFPDHELRWLEKASHYANNCLDSDTRTAFLWCLMQAALAKRPYNLFHRSNLSMREKDVVRSFGNKATWEKSFGDHLLKFAKEHQQFALPGAVRPVIMRGNVLDLPTQDCDMIYLDPPYVTARGTATPYVDFYGFLDILCDPSLVGQIDTSRPHRPLSSIARSEWESKATIAKAFEDLLDKYAQPRIAISYRDEGFPSMDQLVAMVEKHKRRVTVEKVPIRYALSSGKDKTHEILIVGV